MSRTWPVWFESPDGPSLLLGEAPQLESWDARASPSQVRLAGYVQRLRDKVTPGLGEIEGPAAVELIIGRERTRPGDLDNFLTPLARALSRPEIASSRARWSRQAESAIRVGSARMTPPPGPSAGWGAATALTTISADGPAWKECVSEQVGRHPSADTREPLEVVICLRVGPLRNWVSLWKQTIDALGGILGMAGTRRWHPRDDRIERLALHRTIDPSLGWSIDVAVWWRPTTTEAHPPGGGWASLTAVDPAGTAPASESVPPTASPSAVVSEVLTRGVTVDQPLPRQVLL